LESINLLQDLMTLPAGPAVADCIETVAAFCSAADATRFDVELAAGVEYSLRGLFDWRNVPDNLFKGHQLQYPGKVLGLHEHFTDVMGRGESSVTGLVNGLKGKLAELHAPDVLSQHFPGFHFVIPTDPTMPIWDIMGIGPDGAEVLIQVKMGTLNYAANVAERMHESPDVYFAVGHELYATLSENFPEMADKLIDLSIMNCDFTDDINENLQLLAENNGFDVPDSVGDFLPYISEIVLGIRLVWYMVSVERDFKSVNLDSRARVHAMKAITLFGRFGVSTVCTVAAGTAGSVLLPGPGLIVGSISGAVGAGLLNRKLKPRMLDVSMAIAGVTKDDLFYFQNKPPLDALGHSFVQCSTSVSDWAPGQAC